MHPALTHKTQRGIYSTDFCRKHKIGRLISCMQWAFFRPLITSLSNYSCHSREYADVTAAQKRNKMISWASSHCTGFLAACPLWSASVGCSAPWVGLVNRPEESCSCRIHSHLPPCGFTAGFCVPLRTYSSCHKDLPT